MEGIWLISYIVLWVLVLVLVLLVLLLYRQLGIMYLGSAEGVSRDGLPKGKKAPEFNLTDQYGNAQRLASYAGRPTVLLFGSPHCGPCRTLLPQLDDWAAAHPEVGVVWLNAASPEESLKFASEMGAVLPIASYTPEENLMDKYRVRVTPFMFIVDEGGTIRVKGLLNSKGGMDLYYKEYKDVKAGKRPGEEEEESQEAHEERAVAQEVS